MKSLHSNTQNQKEVGSYWPHVKQPINFPQKEAQKQRKVERPLKSEHVKGRFLQKPQPKPDFTITALSLSTDREYKSADTYRNYLQFVHTRDLARQRVASHMSDATISSDYGFDSKVLQSVIDVNLPNDIAQSAEADEQLENKSIVVEIKSSWQETGETALEVADGAGDDDGATSGHTCPANTPLPHE